MKILVTGATGQLGYDVCRTLWRRGIPYLGLSSRDWDIADARSVLQQVEAYHPNGVIHCAAWTAVDEAERHAARVLAVNARGTENLAMACKAVDCKLLYLSTDYVFSGEKAGPYLPDDAPRPMNVYGKSKCLGERAVVQTLSKYFIVRTSWMFGVNGKNFVESMLRLGAARAEVSVVDDQIGSPTYTADLATLLCDMIGSERYGLYHATNGGVCSWADFAREIFKQAGLSTAVRPVCAKVYGALAPRPANSVFDQRSLEQAGFSPLPPWQDALHRYLRERDIRETGSVGKRILVTGGNGYIGKHLVKVLLDMGHAVTVATTGNTPFDPRAARCPVPIFSGAENIYELVGRPDVCIHMAWKDGFVHTSPAHMENLSQHITFCRNMMAGGLPVLSCMGTMHEVGYWEGAIDENTPCNPQSQYGIAKNAMRQSLLRSAEELGCAFHWLRLYYIVGDSVEGSSIFAKLMQAAQAGKTRFPITSGKNKFDFLPIGELARLIAIASLQTEVTGVTNVCKGEPESLGICIERFIREHDLCLELAYGEYPDRPCESPGVWGDAAKLKRILHGS